MENASQSPASATSAAQTRRYPPPKWKVEALETKIFSIEEEIAGITMRLADPTVYQKAADAVALKSRYEALVAECAKLTREWEELTS